MEAIIFILLLTTLRTAEVEEKARDVLGSLTTYEVLVSLATAFVGALAVSFSVLFVFHMFLQFTGRGTYGWMIERRNEKMAKRRREAEEAKAKQDSTNSTNKRSADEGQNAEKDVELASR